MFGLEVSRSDEPVSSLDSSLLGVWLLFWLLCLSLALRAAAGNCCTTITGPDTMGSMGVNTLVHSHCHMCSCTPAHTDTHTRTRTHRGRSAGVRGCVCAADSLQTYWNYLSNMEESGHTSHVLELLLGISFLKMTCLNTLSPPEPCLRDKVRLGLFWAAAAEKEPWEIPLKSILLWFREDLVY